MALIHKATVHLSKLLDWGYSEKASIKLTGDHFRLKNRQREVLRRITSSQAYRKSIAVSECKAEDLEGQILLVDTFNLLIFLESLFSGGFLFEGLDGVFRDLTSVHGNYREVAETEEPLKAIIDGLSSFKPALAKFYIDKPVSNSGRLATSIRHITDQENWQVDTVLCNVPDREMIDQQGVILISDSHVLAGTTSWFNFGRWALEEYPLMSDQLRPALIR